MNKKVIIYILLSLLCMTIIFVFSSKNTNDSNGTSKELIHIVITTYEKIFHKEVDEVKIVEKLNYPTRKMAHYSLYFLLGVFIYLLFLNINIKNKELFATLFCLCYAITDEFHQLFVSGRTGQVKDIIIDVLGSLTAITILYLLYTRRKRNIEKNIV